MTFQATSVVAAGALALGALFISTATADARESEEQIKTDCTNEVQGDYSTSTNSQTGVTTSKCCYEGMTGMSHCDVFYDGEWNSGDSYRDDAPPPSGPIRPDIGGTGPTMPVPDEEPAPPPRAPVRAGVMPTFAPSPGLA